MTDEINIEKNTDTINQSPVSNSLSTREIMEANWDRLVLNEETEPTEPSSSPQDFDETNKAPFSEEAFDSGSYLDEHFSVLKEKLALRGISSPKEWLNALVDLEKEYVQSPTKVIFKLAEQAGFHLPNQEEARQILMDYCKKNRPSLPQMPHPVSNEKVSPQFENFINIPSKSDVQQMIKEGISAYFKEKEAETQKAKNSSFLPNGVAQKGQSSATHLPNGRLKTTREILEEGCRLLGL